jgi:hypothetical protein
LEPSYYTVSIVHVTLALTVAAGALTLLATEQAEWTAKARGRAVLGPIAAAAWILAYAQFFPLVLQGLRPPFDPFVAKVLAAITEHQPLLPTDLTGVFLFVLNLGAVAFCVPFAVKLLIRGSHSERAMAMVSLTGLAVFAPYALLMMRATAFAHLFLIPVWVLAAKWVWSKLWIAERRTLRLLALPLTGTVLFANVIAASAFAATYGLSLDWLPSRQCRVKDIAPMLRALPLGGRGVMLADIYLGSEIVYRTNLSVIGAPYSQNVDGIRDTYRIFGARDVAIGRTLLQQRKADYVLICRNASPQQVAALRYGQRNLFAAFYLEEFPPWAQPVPLPGRLNAEWLLVRVDRE